MHKVVKAGIVRAERGWNEALQFSALYSPPSSSEKLSQSSDAKFQVALPKRLGRHTQQKRGRAESVKETRAGRKLQMASAIVQCSQTERKQLGMVLMKGKGNFARRHD